MKYYNNARFTYHTRKEIKRRVNDGESVAKVAKDFNTTRKTIYKWSGRESFYDLSSRPKKYGYPQCKWKPPKVKPIVIRFEKR